MFVVAATYRAKAGHERALLEIIETMAAESRSETGLRMYQAHRAEDDAQTFFFYEQYDSRAAYEAHLETEHFKRHIMADAIPNHLESRERQFFETLDFGGAPS